MTVANIRYNYLAHPWDSPLSFGVQAFIEYNGIVLNDRNQGDRIRVTGIAGLDDAEVRDARELIPGAHGEFAYDAFYGGRVIVLTGMIESGSLQVLKAMERDLKAAFAPLVEAPMKFRWFDIKDNFDDPQTIFPYNPVPPNAFSSGNYEAVVGSLFNVQAENGLLSWKNPGKDYFLRVAEKRLFGDVQTSMRITMGNTGFNSNFALAYGVLNGENFVRSLYSQNGGEPFIALQTLNNNVSSTIEKVMIPSQIAPLLGSSFWLRGRKEENFLIAEYWREEPSDFNLPALTITGLLEGGDAERYGNGKLFSVGFGGNQLDSSWSFDNFNIQSLYPGDVIFKARKLNSLSFKDEQTTLQKFKRSFQITMKTSDFRAFGATQSRKISKISESEEARLGRAYPRLYPLSYKQVVNEPKSINLLYINNRGRVFTSPVIVVYGPFSNLYIKNLTNDQEIFWTGSAASNDFIIFDCGKAKTVTNSIGVNEAEDFSSNSSAWIILEPGENELFISAKEISEETKVVVYWNHAYL